MLLRNLKLQIRLFNHSCLTDIIWVKQISSIIYHKSQKWGRRGVITINQKQDNGHKRLQVKNSFLTSPWVGGCVASLKMCVITHHTSSRIIRLHSSLETGLMCAVLQLSIPFLNVPISLHGTQGHPQLDLSSPMPIWLQNSRGNTKSSQHPCHSLNQFFVKNLTYSRCSLNATISLVPF